MEKKRLSWNCLQGENLICFATALSPRNENIWREFLNCHHFLPNGFSWIQSLCLRPHAKMAGTSWRTRTHFAAVSPHPPQTRTCAFMAHFAIRFCDIKMIKMQQCISTDVRARIKAHIFILRLDFLLPKLQCSLKKAWPDPRAKTFPWLFLYWLMYEFSYYVTSKLSNLSW